MRPVRAAVAAISVLIAGESRAQDGIAEKNLLQQTLKAAEGAWKGKKIAEAGADIYTGGVQYGSAVTNPNRTAEQTRQGVAGGMRAVGGGAALAGTIGGAGGTMAASMAVPIQGGIAVLPEHVTKANQMGETMDMVARGDVAALEKRELEGIQRAQKAAEDYKGTMNNYITNPRPYDLGDAVGDLTEYAKNNVYCNITNCEDAPEEKEEEKEDYDLWRYDENGARGVCTVAFDKENWQSHFLARVKAQGFYVPDSKCVVEIGLATESSMDIKTVCTATYNKSSKQIYISKIQKISDEKYVNSSYLQTVTSEKAYSPKRLGNEEFVKCKR